MVGPNNTKAHVLQPSFPFKAVQFMHTAKAEQLQLAMKMLTLRPCGSQQLKIGWQLPVQKAFA